MSFTPDFKLGFWNAWSFIFVSLLIGFVSWSLLGKKAMKKFRFIPNGPKNGAKNTSQKLFLLLAIVSMVYTVFLPIKLGNWKQRNGNLYLGQARYSYYMAQHCFSTKCILQTIRDKDSRLRFSCDSAIHPNNFKWRKLY